MFDNQELVDFNKSSLKNIEVYLTDDIHSEVKEIYEQAVAYWNDPTEKQDLMKLRVSAWTLNDRLYSRLKLKTRSEVFLRMVICCLYGDFDDFAEDDSDNIEEDFLKDTQEFMVFLTNKMSDFSVVC